MHLRFVSTVLMTAGKSDAKASDGRSIRGQTGPHELGPYLYDLMSCCRAAVRAQMRGAGLALHRVFLPIFGGVLGK